MRDLDIIIGGNLNLTISSCEVWGVNSRLESLASFFNDLFSSSGPIDVHCSPQVPTQRNGREGDARVSKILDRFLISESLLMTFKKFQSWVGVETILDHQRIWLQLERNDCWKSIPFKLYHH